MSRSVSKGVTTSSQDLLTIIDTFQRVLSNYALSSGGLAIKTSSSALAKTAAAMKYLIDGQMYSLAAGDMAALAGTVTNAKFNVFVFTVDAAGNVYTQMGTEGATLGAVVMPTIADNRAVIGFVIINPTGTGNFVGGTTALDDGTVVPNAVYVNTPYPFLPSIVSL